MPLQFPDMTIAARKFSSPHNLAGQYKERKERNALERAYNVLSGGKDIDNRSWLRKVTDERKGIKRKVMDQQGAMNELRILNPEMYDRIIKRQEVLEKEFKKIQNCY